MSVCTCEHRHESTHEDLQADQGRGLVPRKGLGSTDPEQSSRKHFWVGVVCVWGGEFLNPQCNRNKIK